MYGNSALIILEEVRGSPELQLTLRRNGLPLRLSWIDHFARSYG